MNIAYNIYLLTSILSLCYALAYCHPTYTVHLHHAIAPLYIILDTLLQNRIILGMITKPDNRGSLIIKLNDLRGIEDPAIHFHTC